MEVGFQRIEKRILYIIKHISIPRSAL